MAIKENKPYTPSRRFITFAGTEDTPSRQQPEKSLLRPRRSIAGKNNSGRTTARFRGGGHPLMYRVIDFKRDKQGVPARVHSIEYDPNRSARISLLHYADGEKRYILTPEGLLVGDTVISGEAVDIRPG